MQISVERGVVDPADRVEVVLDPVARERLDDHPACRRAAAPRARAARAPTGSPMSCRQSKMVDQVVAACREALSPAPPRSVTRSRDAGLRGALARRARSTPRGSRSRRTVDVGNACAIRIVDAPWPQPTSATRAPAPQLRLDAVERREPRARPGWRRSRAGRSARCPSKRSWSCSCQPTPSPVRNASVIRGSASQRDRARAGTRRAMKAGLVLVGERERLLGRELYAPVAGVVLDVAAGGLRVQPLAHVALGGAGALARARRASSARARPAPGRARAGRRSPRARRSGPRRGRRRPCRRTPELRLVQGGGCRCTHGALLRRGAARGPHCGGDGRRGGPDWQRQS